MLRTLVLVCVVAVVAGAASAGEVSLSGLIQTQYVSQQDPGGDTSNFITKAARLRMSSKLTEKISTDATFEAAKDPVILEAMVDYALKRNLTFRFGQFTVPFGYEIQASQFSLETAERSQVISHLLDNGTSSPYLRDVGVMAMGRLAVLDCRVACVNGVGYNYDVANSFPKWGADNNNTKDIIGRVGVGIPMFAGLGFSFYQGKWCGELKNEDRTAAGLDLYLDTGKIIFQMEYLRAEGLNTKNGWATDKWGGYYVILGYRVTPLVEPVFKYDKFDPNRDSDDDEKTDMYMGVCLNFEGKARLHVLYRTRDEEPSVDNNAVITQVSAKF